MTQIRKFLEKNSLLLLLGIAFPILVMYDLIQGNCDIDTYYYELAATHFVDGRIDSLRTPIYPIFLRLCFLLSSEHYVLVVVIVQSVFYLLSVVVFYKTSGLIIKDNIVAFFATLLYITIPIPGWCHLLLTESLSASFCVFLIYWIVSHLKSPKTKYDVLICLCNVFLVFLRPTFVFLFVLLPLLWVYHYCLVREKQYILSLILSLCPILLYGLYCNGYYKEYDKFSMSISFECNTIYNLHRCDLWSSDCLTEESQIKVFNYIDSNWNGSYSSVYDAVNEGYKLPVIDEMCRTMINSNSRLYSGYRNNVRVCSLVSYLPSSSFVQKQGFGKVAWCLDCLFSLRLSFFYVFTILAILFCIYSTIRHRRIPLFYSILLFIVSAQGFGILLTASESHNRLLIPIVPAFYLLLAMSIDKMVHKRIQ